MANFKKSFVFALLVLLVVVVACKGKNDGKTALDEVRTGTQGITLSFFPNAPPDKIHVEQGADVEANSFEVIIDLKNKGAYPQPNEGVAGAAPGLGKVYLSGFDPNIIEFKSSDGKSGDLSKLALEGKSTLNPNGGQDLMSFKGTVVVDNLIVDKYEPTFLATACYYYFTVAGPTACIDPNPYAVTREKKVCEVKDITLTGQGAPIAVTKIEEKALAAKTQFKIAIKNVGGGDVILSNAIEKCDPSGQQKIQREEIDKVLLQEVKIANKQLQCGPFADGTSKGTGGLVRLINGEGFVICELPSSDYGNKISAYTSPLNVHLSYGYRATAEKKVQIIKEASGIIGGTRDYVPSQPSQQPENQPFFEDDWR